MIEHPRTQLDDLLGHGVRLSIVAAMTQVEHAEFAFLRDSLQVSDPTLSKQIALLEKAGYVEVLKVRAGRRVRTLLVLSDAGRAALARHLGALQEIAGSGLSGPPAVPDGVGASSRRRNRLSLDGNAVPGGAYA